MIVDELEAQARRLGLETTPPTEPQGYLTLRVARPNLRPLRFNFEHNGLLRSTDPCWVPGNNFPGDTAQANLDWGMAVLLQYAGAAPDDERFRTVQATPLALPQIMDIGAQNYPRSEEQSYNSYLIPPTHLPVEQIMMLRQSTVRQLQVMMMRLSISGRGSDISIRSLEPRDVGLRSWTTLSLRTDGARVYIQHALPGNAVIGIYGVYNRSRGHHATQLQMCAGGNTRAELDLCSLYGLGSTVGLLTEPVIFTRFETMLVRVYADQNRPRGERIGLLGFITEPMGASIASPPM